MTFPSTIIVASGSCQKQIDQILTDLGLNQIQNNPDILVIGQDNLPTISDIRSLNHFLSQKPFSHSNKLVIIYQSELLNNESQNALLKNLEEPGSNNYILLVTNSLSPLLPTIISRCQIVRSKRLTTPPKKLPLSTDVKATLISIDELPKNEIATLMEEELSFLHQQLVTDDVNSWHQITLLLKAIDMTKHNVDTKSAIDFYLLNRYLQ